MVMYHIRRGFQKYRRGGGADSGWSMFCACMPLTQTALSMYKEQILCFFYGKSGYFGDRTMEMYHIRRGFKKL